MEFTSLDVADAWLATSKLHVDNRGNFREWFKRSEILDKTNINFVVEQSNVSLSNRGVLRGIHYSLAEGGQAKWVTCTTGHIIDFVVDIRPNSPTFKKYVAIDLKEGDGRSIFIGPGLGHAFLSIQDGSTVSYLLSSGYSPEMEFEINPMDSELAINWHLELIGGSALILSPKDAGAPTLSQRITEGRLPKK